MRNQYQRREFVKKIGTGAAALSATRLLSARNASANETIRVGCIGTGARCREMMRKLRVLPNVRLVAVCDVWDEALEAGRELAEPGAFATKHYKAILERRDVDAVFIASPDHWHVTMVVDACDAGKDVYVEKPLTHDLHEGRKAIDAKNRTQRIVQVGMQQRSLPHIQEAYQIVQSGEIGKIIKVHLTWNRNSPIIVKKQYNIDPATVNWKDFLGPAGDQPYDEYRQRNWRWFWDFGGGILCDLMVHFLDIVHQFCDVNHPSTAATIGDHLTTKGIWETPDTIQTLLHYPEQQLEVYFEGTFSNARNGAMAEFMGTKATLYVDRGRYEIHPEDEKGGSKELILGKGKRGADFYDDPDCGTLHLKNWLECIRSRAQPNTTVEAGVSAASGAHLGNIAYRTGQTAQWEEVAALR